MSHEDNRTIEHHHHQQQQQHQQHQQHHQENNHHQNNHQQQVHHQIVQHVIHHPHQQQQQQQITIHQQQQQQQSRPIIHHHQIIETIKTEDVDIKPSIHELMSVGSMDVDAQQSNNGENVHGIVVTPEIGNMMTTPTQIGKISHDDF
jgi:hypothetical protein